jgi:hypothetical protein
MSAQSAYEPHTHTEAPAAPVVREPVGGILLRIVLTLAGAAGLIISAFMNWTGGTNGTDLSYRAFYRPVFVDGSFFTTVGVVMIGLGLLALLGAAPRSGVLTSLAGVCGIAGFVLFVIQLGRADQPLPGSIDAGAWIALAGGIVAVVAGFFGRRRVVVTGTRPVAVE